MKLLALESSTHACSVALRHGDDVRFRHAVEPRKHTQLLLPMINELLAEADLAAADIDAVVLGNGPGSFIGMRIAASVAQGLCFASGAPLVPVSSLEVLAAAAFARDDCTRVLVAQDARMNEVYLAGYAPASDGLPANDMALRLQVVGKLDDLPAGYCAAGAAWQQYPQLWAANEEQLTMRLDIDYPHARDLLEIGTQRWREGGGIAPEQLQPAYVRERVAARPGEVNV